jgi:hypothetical protein
MRVVFFCPKRAYGVKLRAGLPDVKRANQAAGLSPWRDTDMCKKTALEFSAVRSAKTAGRCFWAQFESLFFTMNSNNFPKIMKNDCIL